MELCVTSKISAQHPDGTSLPFAEGVALARAVGFTQMDYGITAAAMRTKADFDAALAHQRIAADAGITFRYAHLPFDYPSAPDGWAAFDDATRRAIDLAVAFGVECAALHPRTFMSREYDHDALRDESLEFLRPYVAYAKSAGLTIALENMRGAGKHADPAIRRYATETDDVIDLAQTLDTGICWDTGHGHISGQDAYASLKKVAPRLKMLHVNDNFAEDDVHLAPYLGKVDWTGVTRALREIGFAGAINLEVNCNRRPLALRAHYAAYMAESAKLLRTAIENE